MRIRIWAIAEVHLVVARQVHVGCVDLQHRNGLRAAQRTERRHASGERPTAEVTISGYSALPISCAASSITCSDGAAGTTPSGRTLSRRIGTASSASTSRGRQR